jgi:hypothetical protein
VEWLDLIALVEPGQQTAQAPSRKKKTLASAQLTEAGLEHDVLLPASHYALIIPGAMVQSVGPVLKPEALLPEKAPQAIPVFQGFGLLDLPLGDVAASRLIYMSALEGPVVGLLVPQVAALDQVEDARWFGKPGLPLGLSGWVSKVRVAHQMPQYLLDSTHLSQILSEIVVNAPAHSAFRGWLSADFFNSSN